MYRFGDLKWFIFFFTFFLQDLGCEGGVSDSIKATVGAAVTGAEEALDKAS